MTHIDLGRGLERVSPDDDTERWLMPVMLASFRLLVNRAVADVDDAGLVSVCWLPEPWLTLMLLAGSLAWLRLMSIVAGWRRERH